MCNYMAITDVFAREDPGFKRKPDSGSGTYDGGWQRRESGGSVRCFDRGT